MPFLAQQLSQYAFKLRFEDLPKTTQHEAKRRVIDALGCALGALHAEPAEIALKLALKETSSPGAPVFGGSHPSSLTMASFHLGVLIRYLDFNDTYLSKEPAHPSDNLAPCLACAQASKSTGKQIITALVLGYEVQCRMADAASIRAQGWDHVSYGTFSSALLAAKLFKLSEEQILQAINLAGVYSLALRQTRVGELSMWKGCAFAGAARQGLFAAQLARQGMSGPSPIFEGEMGFFKQARVHFELKTLGGVRGAPFMIERTSIKFFPAEYHAQSAIEAALILRKHLAEEVEAIQSIEIQSFDAAVDIIGGEKEKWFPKSRETADHSLPYCVAVALMDGEVGLDQFSPKRIADPQLSRLIQKIKVVRNKELSAQYPAGIPNLLKIKTKSGQVLSQMVKFPKGHAKNPLSDTEVEKKLRDFGSAYFSASRLDAILDRLWNLEKLGSWQEVARLIQIGKKRS